MEEDKINIELKSEVLNEVLSSPPSWLIRSGNTLFFFFILMLLALSWIISYPDEQMGEVTIYSSRPPVEFQNQLFGKLVDLRVKDQQFVKKGQVLVQFNNEINPKHIVLVQHFLMKINKMDSFSQVPISQELERINLGQLQTNWTNLLALIKERNALERSNILTKKVSSLKEEVKQRQKLNAISKQKLKLIEKEIKFQQTQLLSAQRLSSKGAISKEEVLKEEKIENQLQQQLQNQREAVVQNEIQLSSLQKSIVETEYETQNQIQKLQTAIKTGVHSIQNLINEWGKSTAWVAPFDGKILFNKQLNLLSFYKAGEASLVIVPKGNSFTGIMYVSSTGAGKIEKNQKTFIEFLDFPKNDYGMLEGKIKSITSIAKDDKYEIEVKLPQKLITTYKKEIPIRAALKGTAKIITKNKKLIERFFEKVISLIEK